MISSNVNSLGASTPELMLLKPFQYRGLKNKEQSSLSNYEEYYEELKSSTNISEFLYYISLLQNITLTTQQIKNFSYKKECINKKNYKIISCGGCGKSHFYKTPCNSFFCSECRSYLANRLKRNASKFLFDCNHFFAVFTLPQEIRDRVTSWHSIHEKKLIKDKNYQSGFREKDVRHMDLVYKCVSDAIKIHNKELRIRSGYILLPHTYGSDKFNWSPHINVLASSKGLDENGNIKSFKFDYNKLRNIYKKCLIKNFKISFNTIPQIRFAKRKDNKARKSVYISHKRSISVILDYFRHIPIKRKNIVKIEGGYIYYQTPKSKSKKIIHRATAIEFFKLIMQHIPPANFRTARSYGLYSNRSKNRGTYPVREPKQLQNMKCNKCEKEFDMEKDSLLNISWGQIVWVNPHRVKELLSILDCIDFECQIQYILEHKGRLETPIPPPDSLKPPETLNFPGKDDFFPISNDLKC